MMARFSTQKPKAFQNDPCLNANNTVKKQVEFPSPGNLSNDIIDHNQIQALAMRVNNLLAQFCSYRIGDINSNALFQKIKILQIIQYLAIEVSKNKQMGLKMSQYRRKSEQFLLEREELLQKMSKQQKTIEVQKQAIMMKKQNLQRSFRQSIEKLVAEKDDLQKQLRKIQTRQKAIQVQFRKKDNQIKFLQESLKKAQQKYSHKGHNFQIYQVLDEKKTRLEQSAIKNEYNQLALLKIQETLKLITQQNKLFQQYFVQLGMELNTVFQAANQRVKRSQFLDEQFVEKLPKIKLEIYKMPLGSMHFSKENTQIVFEGLKKLRELLEQIQHPNIVQRSRQMQSLDEGNWKIKKLMQNYKQVIISQDQILNKIIVKAEGFKEQGNEREKKCFNALQNLELEKIRALVEQHMSSISSVNRQLTATKMKIAKGISRIQQIKHEVYSNY